jgi:hypothetical protein
VFGEDGGGSSGGGGDGICVWDLFELNFRRG